MFDFSTKLWRTFNTEWTFQICKKEQQQQRNCTSEYSQLIVEVNTFGLAFNILISSSGFLASFDRYWLNDWNCERNSRLARWTLKLAYVGTSACIDTYLVDEFIDDVPQPLMRQLQRHRLLSAWNEDTRDLKKWRLPKQINFMAFILRLTQNIIEQTTVVVVRFKTLVKSWASLQENHKKHN